MVKFFLGKLRALWKWLLDPDNRGIVTLLGGFAVTVTGGGWALYIHLSNPTTPAARPPARETFASEVIVIPITPGQLKSFEPLKRESAEENLEQARKAIAKGDMGSAEVLYHKVLNISSEQAGEASYQLGCVAKIRIDYKQADYF